MAIKAESLSVLEKIPVEDCKTYFHAWKQGMYECICASRTALREITLMLMMSDFVHPESDSKLY